VARIGRYMLRGKESIEMPGQVSDCIWAAMAEPQDIRAAGVFRNDDTAKYRITFDIVLDRDTDDLLAQLAARRQRSRAVIVRDAAKHALTTCLTWRRYIPGAGITDESTERNHQ
jgi:predicted transcriptional regulator